MKYALCGIFILCISSASFGNNLNSFKCSENYIYSETDNLNFLRSELVKCSNAYFDLYQSIYIVSGSNNDKLLKLVRSEVNEYLLKKYSDKNGILFLLNKRFSLNRTKTVETLFFIKQNSEKNTFSKKLIELNEKYYAYLKKNGTGP